jgi:hypothetical protein
MLGNRRVFLVLLASPKPQEPRVTSGVELPKIEDKSGI